MVIQTRTSKSHVLGGNSGNTIVRFLHLEDGQPPSNHMIVTLQNTGAVSETDYLVVQIDVEDKNNQIPVFTGFTGCCYEGSIAENAAADTEVIVVSAEDKDETVPFNEVRDCFLSSFLAPVVEAFKKSPPTPSRK